MSKVKMEIVIFQKTQILIYLYNYINFVHHA